jgi:hypothetical protein
MAVTENARGQATAGEEMTVSRRVHTVRHGQGSPAGTARLETAGVGITGLTTYDQDGTPERGRQHNRRDFEPHAINAVVVRKWNGKDDGPVGKAVFLTGSRTTTDDQLYRRRASRLAPCPSAARV